MTSPPINARKSRSAVKLALRVKVKGDKMNEEEEIGEYHSFFVYGGIRPVLIMSSRPPLRLSNSFLI